MCMQVIRINGVHEDHMMHAHTSVCIQATFEHDPTHEEAQDSMSYGHALSKYASKLWGKLDVEELDARKVHHVGSFFLDFSSMIRLCHLRPSSAMH